MAHAQSQKPLVSFSQVTLTWCKRKESITQWWIDYSHASFWEPIFLCELNLKLNLLPLPPFLSWQMEGASKVGPIWICDWWNPRWEVNLLPHIWPCSNSKCRDLNGNFCSDAFGYGEGKAARPCSELTTQLEHHICGVRGCFIIWMNSFQNESKIIWLNEHNMIEWGVFTSKERI